MRSANAVFDAMINDCAAFGALYNDALSKDYELNKGSGKLLSKVSFLRAKLLKELAAKIVREGDE